MMFSPEVDIYPKNGDSSIMENVVNAGSSKMIGIAGKFPPFETFIMM
ncbi:hypothetical protein [Candidatus Liberibacter sp.]|nr:hypothetical protein [Candidatus Liberibacter sp.]MBA5724286.1 hypothetical protein [Candidatus Liberibacter sp.]